MLDKYISLMSKSLSGFKPEEHKLIKDIFQHVDSQFIKGIMFYHFLTILTYRQTDNEEHLSLLGVTLALGKKIINKFLYTKLIKKKPD